jgi:hypothetical protein
MDLAGMHHVEVRNRRQVNVHPGALREEEPKWRFYRGNKGRMHGKRQGVRTHREIVQGCGLRSG